MKKMSKRLTLVTSIWLTVLMGSSMIPAWAQSESPQVEMQTEMNATSMDNMNQESKPDMDHGTEQKMDHSKMQGMHHGSALPTGESGMTEMSHGSMQGGWAPANARDPHAYSGGYDFGPIPRPRLADELNFGSLLVDRLEAVRSSDNTSAVYELQAWYGRDYDRAVFKAEGDYDNNKLEEASSELLWSHAVHAYWNTQLGVRYDIGEGPDRTWLAFGIQGLAPYWFEVDVTGYIGNESRFAINLEAEYELLLSQKLILQPSLEANLYLKDDAEVGIGSGLSELAVGLRLRYEIYREFAPYIGVEWVGMFGGTANQASDAGQDTNETQAVAGIRFWF